eukprot:gene15305-biopygen3228
MPGTRAGRREGGTSLRPGAVPLDSVGSEGAGTAESGTEEHEGRECTADDAGTGTGRVVAGMGTENAETLGGDESI